MSQPASTTALASQLPEVRKFDGRPAAADMEGLPGAAAVALLVDQAERPILLITTQNLRRITLSRLSPDVREAASRTDLAEITRGIRWRVVFHAFEARWWYLRVARALYPADYRKRVSFGPVSFLAVDWNTTPPELRISEKIWVEPGEFIGPFATRREGQATLEMLWDIFDLCRYPEQVRQAPHGRRCAYADMGRCDAPCDGGAPMPQYIERQRRAWAAASESFQGWTTDAVARMRAAAADRKFELAGQLKQQIENARAWAERPNRRLWRMEQLQLLLVLPAVRRRAWKVFLFARGELYDGPLTPHRSAERMIGEWLASLSGAAAANASTPLERMEQTWLVGDLLARREAEAAWIEPAPENYPGVGAGACWTTPSDWLTRLREGLDRLRKKSAEAAGPPEEDSAAFPADETTPA